MEWLFANLFLLVVILVAAGLFFALGSIIGMMQLSHDAQAWAFAVAVVLSIVGTYYISKALHGFIQKRL